MFRSWELGIWDIEFNIPEGGEHARRWVSMSSISEKGEREELVFVA